jgi:hypothetical protein
MIATTNTNVNTIDAFAFCRENPNFNTKKNNKSRKQKVTDRIAKRRQEATNKRNRSALKEPIESQFRIPEIKLKKKSSVQKKQRTSVASSENLLACWEDIEFAEEDAENEIIDGIARMEMDNIFREFSALERKMDQEKDDCITLEEYEKKKEQEHLDWLMYKGFGLSRKQFEDDVEYRRNCAELQMIQEELDYQAYGQEYAELLRAKIQSYEDALQETSLKEEARMNEWFSNFAENNPDFVRKIQERNWELELTIMRAIQEAI